MAFVWTPEKIAALSTAELNSLYKNASDAKRAEIVTICEAELLARKPVKKPSFNAPEGFVPVVRTALTKKLELDAVEMIVQLANDLKKTYDFDTEKARSLSADAKHFIPHRLLDAKGSAKVGGAQKQGRVAFDRYISYRLKDEVYALIAILFDSDDQKSVRYQVFGPPRLLENFAPLAEVRPYLMDDEVIGKSSGGEEFDNFEEAANRFRWLIEQVAPKLKN
jgi:hypothetical protein